MDLQETISPKSNQLNADDLIGGPITITILKIELSGNENQPVAIFFEGNDTRPYLPCKSMRRVMVAAWGRDGTQYVGRHMTLFRDPTVIYGGLEVGGIRISHLSHMNSDMTIPLTISRSKRIKYLVRRLTSPGEAPEAELKPPPVDQGGTPPLRRRLV